ncbi:MAG: carboxypeptidase regulatory-like domain-containing protein, partial [bacterium]|nr:carboxypeptidase regulatory-like domain-containing protein [bacterium]
QPGENYEEINSEKGAISGKVINYSTGRGLPDIDVELTFVPKGYSYKTKTGTDGHFLIRNMHRGEYELDRNVFIKSCPKGLEAPATTKTFKLVPGKILKNAKIYLQRVTTISGYVYDADMVTPLKNVRITKESGYYVHYNRTVYTDKRGWYHLSGFESGQKVLAAYKSGYASEVLRVTVKSGKDYKHAHFILGKGSVSVKGKIVSALDNQPIEDAGIYFSARMVEKRFSCGGLRTDYNGEYEMVGIKAPGPFEVIVSHEKYYGIGIQHTIKLKPGLNILNFDLIPRKTEEKNEKNAPGNNAKK